MQTRHHSARLFAVGVIQYRYAGFRATAPPTYSKAKNNDVMVEICRCAHQDQLGGMIRVKCRIELHNTNGE